MKWRSLPPAAICRTWYAPKLHKARAFALRNGTPAEQETALELLRTALIMDHGAGVKKPIDKLSGQLKNAAAANAGTEQE